MAEKATVSVIMPAYNEERQIEECFNRVVEALREYGQPFEVILEQDGSTDKTPQIIGELAKKHPFVTALNFPSRRGKGFGVRKGFEAARGELLVLIDSDLEYPPERIPDLLRSIGGNDIVIGTRSLWKNVKNGRVKAVRAILSRIFGGLVKTLFKVDPWDMQDPQSGFKALRRSVVEAIQPITSDGFEIDTEILIKALRRGFKVGFIPITYTYKGDSKVNILSDPFRMFLSILGWKANGKLEVFKEAGSGEDSPHSNMYFSSNPLVRWIHNLRLRKSLSLLDGDKGYLLDVGCGDGYFLRRAEAQYKVGLDISRIRLRRAKRIARDAELILGDAHNMPLKDEALDKILCCDLLEHLPFPDLAVSEMTRVLKRDGEIIVSTPNERIWTLGRLALLQRPLGKDVHRHNLSSVDIQKMSKYRRACVERIPFNNLHISLWEAGKYKRRS